MSARPHLVAILLCLIGSVLRTVCPANNVTWDAPFTYTFGPSTVYGLTCNQVAMGVGRIYNNDPTATGALSLELWAVLNPQNPAAGSYKLATYNFPGVLNGSSYLAAGTYKATLTQPPAGVYCLDLILKENGIKRQERYFVSFSNPSQCLTAAFGHIYFPDDAAGGWQQQGNSVTLQIPAVTNWSAGGTSGALRAQLFATATPFSPTGQTLNPVPGPLMATYTYPNTLCGGLETFSATTHVTPFTTPPAGTYYSVLLLTEQTALGWEFRDYISWPSYSFTVGSPPATVSAPSISPATGTYQGCVDVTLATGTQGAEIRYTQDGTDPTASSTLYSGPFRLTASKTVRAKAFLSGSNPSTIVSAAYTVTAAAVVAPVITPGTGTYTNGVETSISTTTAGAVIRYTTDGTTPGAASPVYSGPLTFTASTTLRARAFKECWTDSGTTTAVLTVNIQSQAGAPVISPNGGNFSGNVQVSLSASPADAEIRYTLNGTVPDRTSLLYSAPFTLTTSATVMARSFKTGLQDSALSVANFTLPVQQTVAAPVFSPNGGTFTGSAAVTLSSTTPGATIYYTTNGTTPTTASTPYLAPFSLTATANVRAIAVKSGWTNSSISSATFTVTPAATPGTPVISPGSGSYNCRVRVTISSDPGTVIRYSIGGADPTEIYPVYTAPFYLYSSDVVRARAYKSGASPSAAAAVNLTITPCPAEPLFSDCAWSVEEYYRLDGLPVNSLADAESVLSGAVPVSGTKYQSATVNRTDPDSPGGGGFFRNDLPYAWNNRTPHGDNGLNGGDDDDFILHARCTIVITQEDDYTFGFSSDDGARLRIEGAVFKSSTRLNTNNPSNPAHNGNTLSFSSNTSNSDTLGVSHLTPGTYTLDFLSWEAGGGAYCEVFAARGARTAVDNSFRLVGHLPSGMVGNSLRINPPGWLVTTRMTGATTLPAALSRIYDWWTASSTLSAIRFTSANDFPERDPFTFKVEGTKSCNGTGPWYSIVAGSSTFIPYTRNTVGSKVGIPNTFPWSSYRITFPSLRDLPAVPNSMQVAEVEIFDANGGAMDLFGKTAGTTILPTSTNSPAGETVDKAFDENPATKYLNFDRENSGIIITPGGSHYPYLNFTDPDAGSSLHGHNLNPFPFNRAGNDDNFAVGARANLTVTTPGPYTFCVLADDGVRVRIRGSSGWTVSSSAPVQALPVALPDGFETTGCCTDVFGTVTLEAGTYGVEVIYQENTGDAYLGLFSAFGVHTGWDGLQFSPLGYNNTITSVPDSAPFALLEPTQFQPPANDDLSAATYMAVQEAHVDSCNTGAITQSGEPLYANMQHTLWWIWVAQKSGRVQVDTIGSDVDAILTVHRRNDSGFSGLQQIAADDDSSGDGINALLKMNAVAGQWYAIQVGSRSTTGHIRLNITPLPAPPANDSFATPRDLGNAASIAINGSSLEATTEAGETLCSPASNSTVWFRWTAPYSGDFLVSTRGSNYNTALMVSRAGSVLSQLQPLTCSLMGPNPATPVRFSAGAGTVYLISIQGYPWPSTGNYVLSLVPVPPVLNSSLSGSGGNRVFNLSWRSEPGQTYRVQTSPDLTTWTDSLPCFGSADTQTGIALPAPVSGPKRQYFRILRE